MSEQAIVWDLALIQKYNYSGPRYTSYPTALEFSESFTETEFANAVARYPNVRFRFTFISLFATSCVTSAAAIRSLPAKHIKRTNILISWHLKFANVHRCLWGEKSPNYIGAVVRQLI